MSIDTDLSPEIDWSRRANADIVQLCVDDGFILTRRRLPAGHDSELLLIPDAARRSASSFEQLHNELRLTSHLEEASVVRAVHLGDYGGQPALRLEDPGGEPLSRADPDGQSLESLLSKAVAIAGAVGRVHAQSILHRALRPANFLVDDDGRAAITGFRQATRFGSATTGLDQAFYPVTDGMPYIAPELTGRLDTPIDARSDLYSLGVVLYELMTGQRPFEASSPAEWVLAHIARKPTLPGHWTPRLPNMVAAVIMKLLSKSPDERYQTAAGLVADLELCIETWKRHGAIESFPLGGQDIREHLSTPTQLYGRNEEITAIAGALDAVRRTGRPRFVFVSGQSGIGKSTLVEAALRTAPFRHATIAAGKFDQLNLDIPFATLAQAFDGPLRAILEEDEQERSEWRDRLQHAVSPNGQLICDVMPALAALLGDQPPVPDMRPLEAQTHFRTYPPSEAQLRFRHALESFIGAFATPERPLALFLDNIQWADHGTLDFMLRLMRETPPMAMVVIAASRAEDFVDDTPLSDTLAVLRTDGDDIVDLHLAPLDGASMTRLVGDALGTPPSEAQKVADVVGDRTAGNPLFALQLLNTFVESGVLAFDPSVRRWRLDEDRAAGSGASNVDDLVDARLGRLPEETRADLARFACLGNSAGAGLIGAALGCPSEGVAERLAPAVSAGLVIRRRDTFAFVHDRVQQAAYDLVPAQGRQQAHLTLGRQLLAALPPEERHTAVFEVAAQFNRGASLLVAAEERARIAALHLEAGSRAAATSAHVTALAYLDAGLSILGEGSNSDLEFELRFRRAESHFLSGDLAAAQAGFATLAAGPLPGDRQARVAVQQITLATAQGDNEAAVAYFLAYMRAAGFDWPVHPDIEQVRAEFGPIFEEIRGNSIEDRLTLPDSDDSNPNILVLIAILPAAFLVDLNLEGLVLGRMVNESRYVNCPGSVVGYTTVGYVLGPLFGEYAAGYQFGCLGMELLERPHLSLFRPRAMMTFAYHILPYARPLHTARELHRKAYESAKEHDDVTYSGFSLCTLISNLLASGEPLASVERQAEKMLASMRRVKFGLIVDMLTSQLMLVRRLRGSTLSILTFDDGDFDEAAFAADFEARLASDRLLAMAACWHYVRKMEGAVFACDYRDALEASARAKSFLWTSVIHLERVEYHLFTAVALAALADENPGCEAALAEHHAELEVYARNAPKNWRHHADLVAAERARLAGYHIDALRGFEASAASARANGFHHIEALAHERAASFCADIGLFAMAEAHRERAHAAYLAWGADGKARAMAELYPSLDKGRGTSGTALSGVGDIDLATVIRSSEAVTGEIALGSLLPTLMRIALENACASRGLLLIPRRDGLWIEAESEVGADEVSVTLRQRAPNARDASLELLAEVVRTQAPVVVGDAISDPRMRDELSAAVRQVRSVLALPLVRQGKLIGVLYLENDATPHAFTPARLAVLRLLASQAAISLENAALEEKEQLLREVHHRVKNNLQLISSLLNLQASRTSDAAVAELFAESRNRVRSMALVHENLYRAGTFARVAMGDHVRALCSHLARAYGEAPNRNAVEVDVAEVELDLDRAIPCGLIVNELVSNALKHAFPDGRAGTIRVTLEAQRQGRFVLSVADDGVGLPDGAESGDTLGLQLVRDLTEQLRGRIEVRSEHGTSFSIIFGVPNGGVQ